MGWRQRELIERAKDALAQAIVWRMPKRLVGWAFVRVWAHATTGKYGSEDATAILAVSCLKRFDTPNDEAKPFEVVRKRNAR